MQPRAVVFDVLGTLVPLDGIRAGLVRAGLPEHLAPVFFTRCQRDGIAATTAGGFAHFKDLAAYHLQVLLAEAGLLSSNDALDASVSSFFDAFSAAGLNMDAVDGLKQMAEAGIALCSFTNGASAVSNLVLERAGLAGIAPPELQLQVSDAGSWKPAASAYHYCCKELERLRGFKASECMMVSIGPWDINGAKRAGMQAAFVAFHGEPYPSFFAQPDLTVHSITGLADIIAPHR